MNQVLSLLHDQCGICLVNELIRNILPSMLSIASMTWVGIISLEKHITFLLQKCQQNELNMMMLWHKWQSC